MPPASPLHGQPLLDFLDRAEAFWNEDSGFDEDEDADDDVPREHHSGITQEDRRAALLEQMQAQRFAPATPDELSRLCKLWMDLDQPKQASAAIHAHLDTVLSAIADVHARARENLHLQLADLWSRHDFDPQGTRAHLPEVQTLIQRYIHAVARAQRPPQDECEIIYQFCHRLAYIALLSQVKDVMDAAYDALRAFEREYVDADDDHASPAFKDALIELYKAHYAVKWHDANALDQHIDAAIAALGAAPTAENWEPLLNRVLDISPAHIPALIDASEAHRQRLETPPPAQPVLTHRNIENARWRAKALAAQEKWDEAAEWAKRGHFLLASEPYNSDEFGAEMLAWLHQAGRIQEAAELAWRGIWYAPWNGMAASAYQLALQMRDQDASTPIWDWILACAQLRIGLLKNFNDDKEGLLAHLKQTPPLSADAYLERARQIAPGHPAPALIEGVALAEQKRWHEALPLLEQGVLALPEYADVPSVNLLWCARFKCLSEEEAISRPFPHSHGATWCHAIGYDLFEGDGFISETCADGHTAHTQERRKALGLRYWEIALTRFQAFFASGDGAYTDSDLWGCSGMCNALGYHYHLQNRLDEAIALFQTGLACMTSRELYSDLMSALLAKGDPAAALTIAEQCWHDRQQDRNDSNDDNLITHASDIALALGQTQRDFEISIWMDRLNEWWQTRQQIDDEEPPNRALHYLRPLFGLLQGYAEAYPQHAEPIVRAHLPELLALDATQVDGYALVEMLRNAGIALARFNDLEHAMDLHQKALAIAPADATEFIDEMRDRIADLQQDLDAIARERTAAKKPKWKFWQ